MTSVERLVEVLSAKRNGNGWRAKCPAHDDHQPSLSIHEGADGRVLLKCFGGCATADIVAAVGLTLRDLFPARSRSRSGKPVPAVKNGTAAFDFHAKCVAALNGKDRIRLSNERWLSRSFCKWLHENGYVGMWHGDFAFPVEDHGKIIAAHCRQRPARLGEKDDWYYYPKGVHVQPFVMGDLTKVKQVHIGESPWDMLALADRTDLYLNEHHAFVATRGAGNAAVLKDLIPPGVSVLAWPQNDEAGEILLKDAATFVPDLAVARVPASIKKTNEFGEVVEVRLKDLNEWTKAGASAEDIYLAMFKNELVEKPLVAEPEPISETDEVLERLAALPLLEYEQKREAEAEKLNCRISALDRLVNAKRILAEPGDLQGRTVNLPDVEPWPKPVNGAEVLDAVAETYLRYIALPAGAAYALALWCAHAFCFFIFQCSPRLNVTSPEKSCGKTTLRDVTGTLVPKPLFTENLTVAVMFRVIDKHKPTLLADECDAWINDNEELRGMLNAGHRRGGQALRCEGESNEVRAFAVFGPAVLCGIGALPGTLHDRSIVIRLERAKPGEVHQRFDPRHVEHEMELCRKLARFVADNMTALELSDPKLPDCAFNRLADNWRPLFAIAEIAGGDWPKRATDAFTKLTSSADVDAQGIGTMLLTDIRDIFDRIEDDPVSVADLVDALVEMEDRPWPEFSYGKPITKVKLSRMLKRFGIVSELKREGKTVFRGYAKDAFNDAFARYTPYELVTSLQNLLFTYDRHEN
jgi:hypothetical protein